MTAYVDDASCLAMQADQTGPLDAADLTRAGTQP
jgi:hypothetical protein